MPEHDDPDEVDGQEPVPYCGALIAGHDDGPLQTNEDQTPLEHCRVVEPEATPYMQLNWHVPPLAVAGQEPLPYCGADMAEQV
jgi:hypothetical protein